MTKRHKPVEFSPLWSPAVVTLLVVVAALSIPYGAIHKHIWCRRKRQFTEKLKRQNRILEWDRVSKELRQQRGTLIVEQLSVKGPVRWWWTTENVYDACPHPIVDVVTMLFDRSSFRPLLDWFHKRYTSVEGGLA